MNTQNSNNDNKGILCIRIRYSPSAVTHLNINMFVDTSYVVGVVGPTANPISEASDTISGARVNIQPN